MFSYCPYRSIRCGFSSKPFISLSGLCPHSEVLVCTALFFMMAALEQKSFLSPDMHAAIDLNVLGLLPDERRLNT